jgi:putative hydrolase of HD superfamily
MKSETETLIDTLTHGNQLKRTIRTGWAQRGIPNPEDVAAHSYGVAFTALVLAQVVPDELDIGNLLSMALLHDLPEGITGDIPPSAWKRLPEGSKNLLENSAMKEILAEKGYGPGLFALWQEYQESETAESKVVHDADKLDMLLQALIYEDQTGNRSLREFWSEQRTFNFRVSQKIYEELRLRRGIEIGASSTIP